MKKLVLLMVLMVTSVFAAGMEMAWDSGIPKAYVEFSEVNLNLKMANDFALEDFTSEPERYGRITYVKVYANLVGCGFNVSIESTRGELLWGPTEMVRYAGERWYKVYAGYKLPDPYMRYRIVLTPITATGETPNVYVDDERFKRHSWQYDGTRWLYLVGTREGGKRYRNLMVRVRVYDKETAVEPTSLGRVKALYN